MSDSNRLDGGIRYTLIRYVARFIWSQSCFIKLFKHWVTHIMSGWKLKPTKPISLFTHNKKRLSITLAEHCAAIIIDIFIFILPELLCSAVLNIHKTVSFSKYAVPLTRNFHLRQFFYRCKNSFETPKFDRPTSVMFV